jgi:hypothetical protein
MIVTLEFDRKDVQRVVEHMVTATKWWGYYQDEHDARPQLVLVKDHGIYLMSNGQPRDIVEGETSFVAYAKGYDPAKFGSKPDFLAELCDRVSGDDFGEFIDLTPDQTALIRSPDLKSFAIVLYEESLEILIQRYPSHKSAPRHAN